MLWDHRPVGRTIRRSAAPSLRLAVTKNTNLTNTRSMALRGRACSLFSRHSRATGPMIQAESHQLNTRSMALRGRACSLFSRRSRATGPTIPAESHHRKNFLIPNFFSTLRVGNRQCITFGGASSEVFRRRPSRATCSLIRRYTHEEFCRFPPEFGQALRAHSQWHSA